MKYTKKALATRQRIIDTASKLFFAQGYSRTRLEEVLDGSKVRKGNFYYYFRGKDDLYLAVVRETARPLVVEWARELVKPQASPRENLIHLVNALTTDARRGDEQDHPLANLALETAGLSEDFRQAIALVMSEVTDVFAAQFERYNKNGIELLGSPRQAAQYLVSIIEGALLMHGINRDPEQLRFTMENATACLFRLAPLTNTKVA